MNFDLNSLIRFCDENELSFECHYFDNELELTIYAPAVENVEKAYFKRTPNIEYAIDYFKKSNGHIAWRHNGIIRMWGVE